MNRHAYLIYAHNNFKILGLLLQLLDDERNDIYLHIDKKVKEFDALSQELKRVVSHSKLHILEKRIDVKWGEISQIKTELTLYREAINGGKYNFYHLLSGVDMPLRNQDEIHAFFDVHQGEEFLVFMSQNPIDRLRYLTLFPICRRQWTIKAAFMRIANRVSYRVQKIIKINYVRNMKLEPKWGSNWSSLTDDAVRYILNYMDKNLKWYRFSKNGDEIYKQTILYNSDFRDRISNLGCFRLTDWQRGKPYTFTIEDYDMLMSNNEAFFARKFDEEVDFEIVEAIKNNLNL